MTMRYKKLKFFLFPSDHDLEYDYDGDYNDYDDDDGTNSGRYMFLCTNKIL